jgi:hypothetical protein
MKWRSGRWNNITSSRSHEDITQRLGRLSVFIFYTFNFSFRGQSGANFDQPVWKDLACKVKIPTGGGRRVSGKAANASRKITPPVRVQGLLTFRGQLRFRSSELSLLYMAIPDLIRNVSCLLMLRPDLSTSSTFAPLLISDKGRRAVSMHASADASACNCAVGKLSYRRNDLHRMRIDPLDFA